MSTRVLLNKLNAVLKSKCSVLTLQFGTLSEMQSLTQTMELYDESSEIHHVLCLMKRKQCIASISMKRGNHGAIEISSKTDPQFEGRKFNIWLRVCVLLIAKRLGASVITSRAVNPISIFVMSKYFHATNPELDEYMHDHSISELTLEHATSFFQREEDEYEDEDDEAMLQRMKQDETFGNPIVLSIQLNEFNDADLYRLLDTIQIKCRDMTGGKTKTKTKKKRRRIRRPRIQTRHVKYK